MLKQIYFDFRINYFSINELIHTLDLYKSKNVFDDLAYLIFNACGMFLLNSNKDICFCLYKSSLLNYSFDSNISFQISITEFVEAFSNLKSEYKIVVNSDCIKVYRFDDFLSFKAIQTELLDLPDSFLINHYNIKESMSFYFSHDIILAINTQLNLMNHFYQNQSKIRIYSELSNTNIIFICLNFYNITTIRNINSTKIFNEFDIELDFSNFKSIFNNYIKNLSKSKSPCYLKVYFDQKNSNCYLVIDYSSFNSIFLLKHSCN